jgi:hypothetical protein
VSGKLFATLRATASPPLFLLLLAGGLGPTAACGPGRRALTRPAAAVDVAVQPERFAQDFRKLGRAHFRGVARFDAGLDGAATETVTTETDIWIDDRGNWRLVELNNKDGGREIVLHGRELAVALRYGKMIRRVAEDPEPKHLLEEGVGAPFAAWDVLRDITTVDNFGEEKRAGRKVTVYKLNKARHPPKPASHVDPADRRGWRRTLSAGSIDGTVVIDQATGLPLLTDFRAKYTMRRAGAPMHGAIDVHTSIEEIGQSPLIARPEAEAFPFRQRTVPEEKALLGGLPRSVPSPRAGP